MSLNQEHGHVHQGLWRPRATLHIEDEERETEKEKGRGRERREERERRGERASLQNISYTWKSSAQETAFQSFHLLIHY